MFYLIYKITNTINDKIYIGKHLTSDPDDNYMGSGKLLLRSIKKYGIENFKKEILFRFDNEAEMNAKEAELVTEEFCDRDDTYNLCPGGKGGFGYINKSVLTTEDRKTFGRMGGIKLKGRKSENFSSIVKSLHQAGMYKYGNFKGKEHTEEWEQIHSSVMKEKSAGSKNSQYGTMWITNGQENKKIKKEIEIIPEGWYKGRCMMNRG